jgi:hypothetical protein
MDTRYTETYMRSLFSSHTLSITESDIEICLELFHIEDIPFSDTARLCDSDSEDSEFLIIGPFSDDSLDLRAAYIYGYELFSRYHIL